MTLKRSQPCTSNGLARSSGPSKPLLAPSSGHEGSFGGFCLARNRGGVSDARAAAVGRSLLARPKSRPGSIFVPSATLSPSPSPSPPMSSVEALVAQGLAIHCASMHLTLDLDGSSDDLLDDASASGERCPSLETEDSCCLSSMSSVSFMGHRASPSSNATRYANKSPSDRKNEEFELVLSPRCYNTVSFSR